MIEAYTDQHESTIHPFSGERYYRWIGKLETGKEFVTWAKTEADVERKAFERRGKLCVSVRPAGNPLEDKPNGR